MTYRVVRKTVEASVFKQDSLDYVQLFAQFTISEEGLKSDLFVYIWIVIYCLALKEGRCIIGIVDNQIIDT